jgi:hypothetical protein
MDFGLNARAVASNVDFKSKLERNIKKFCIRLKKTEILTVKSLSQWT